MRSLKETEYGFANRRKRLPKVMQESKQQPALWSEEKPAFRMRGNASAAPDKALSAKSIICLIDIGYMTRFRPDFIPNYCAVLCLVDRTEGRRMEARCREGSYDLQTIRLHTKQIFFVATH